MIINTKNLFIALALTTTLTACSTDPNRRDVIAGGEDDSQIESTNDDYSDGYGQEGYGTYSTEDIASNTLDNIRPGSQDELIANIGDRVFFGFNSSSLSPSGQQTLTKQAAWLKQYPSTKIVIEGHCDERGTREYNLALGESRANAVKNFLLSLGISDQRISTISYGKEHPEVLGQTEAAWSKNRRSVTVITSSE